jgi:hypothetical protein
MEPPRSAVVLTRLLTGALLLLLVTGEAAGADSPLSGRTLREALRQGGHIIYLRHASAVTGQRPSAVSALPGQFRDCRAPERPLTEAGVAQMRAVREAYRGLGIPVGRVLSSPACRCIETAWYAFGRVEVTPDLMGLWGATVTEAEKAERAAALRRMLSTPPAPGTNTVIAAHISNILAAASLSLEEGEALIFRPDGPEGFRLVARVQGDRWREPGE